ncbi:hypothetical protein BP6252_08709 [Coleophoma cylindrospora]|uniref:Uncharacterized protein n=1 Tax=Coleophoma cylindrospora TaxID=1849047 RepID=A0A3D8R6M3_9HELO|nr:hypothetical protein BP6252_08709 [Coleophoma cylindrospora]
MSASTDALSLNTTLEVDCGAGDDELLDNGVETASTTASLRSNSNESVEENGRTYHKFREGAYLLPNDLLEQDRLSIQHNLFVLTLENKLFFAPVESPRTVLDIGTGTGNWAIDYAVQNPEVKVIGTDLSAIQPEWVPENCSFLIADASDEWTFTEKFDFIHGRALITCFADPAAVFKRAYDALEPGGYFEMQDILFQPFAVDDTLKGTAMEKWNNTLIEGSKIIGRDWRCARNYAKWFKEVGFENVVETKLVWPTNSWPKSKKQKVIGMWCMADSLKGLNAISMAIMTRVLGMSAEEVEATVEEVKKDMQDKSIHAYWPIYVVYGRKPL